MENGIDWAAVRAAYEGGRETVAAIRARFRIAPYALRRRREAEEWVSRPPCAPAGQTRGEGAVTAGRLRTRLLAVAERQITALEARLAARLETGDDADFTREETRAIGELARALATMTKSSDDARRARQRAAAEVRRGGVAGNAGRHPGEPTDTKDAADHAAFLRDELKRRLDGVRRPGGS